MTRVSQAPRRAEAMAPDMPAGDAERHDDKAMATLSPGASQSMGSTTVVPVRGGGRLRVSALSVSVGFLFVLGISPLAPCRAQDLSPDPLAILAAYRCIPSDGPCDTIQVFIEARNHNASEVRGCFASMLTWHYEPSDSLRSVFGIDSLEAAGGRVCRWYPASHRIGAFVDTPFHCQAVVLAPGQAFFDTLTAATGAEDFMKYPGALQSTISVFTGLGGSTWGEVNAVQLGQCGLSIEVPR